MWLHMFMDLNNTAIPPAKIRLHDQRRVWIRIPKIVKSYKTIPLYKRPPVTKKQFNYKK